MLHFCKEQFYVQSKLKLKQQKSEKRTKRKRSIVFKK